MVMSKIKLIKELIMLKKSIPNNLSKHDKFKAIIELKKEGNLKYEVSPGQPIQLIFNK
jgi:hypothetical protein